MRITERDGSSVQIEYNAHGHIQAYIDELGRRTTYAYDAQERPVSITDPLGQVTHIDYRGRGIERVVDALGNETRYVLDAEFRPLQIIQPDGGVTVLEYDPNGRRTAMVDPNGNRTRYTYRVDGRLDSETDPQGGVTTYQYDAVGHQIAVTNPNGHRWETEYDALGYVMATVDPLGGRTESTYDAMGNLTSQTDALGRTTSFEYNNVQRPTHIIDALGGETSLVYAWDGRLLSEQDPLGRVRTYTYDAVNRLTSKTNPLGGTQQFVYDAAGNQVESTDERGSKTQVEYDALNRPVRVTDASGASSQIAYDALGHLIGVTDASGAVSSIEYDAVGRPVATTDPLGGMQRVTYDLAGNLVSSVDVLGRKTTYTYDSLNRQTSKTDSLGATTHRSYDAFGNLLAVRDPLGNVTTFGYDALERYIGSTDPLGAQSSRRYDAVGNVVETVDRNGLKTEFSYDALDRVLGEQWLSDTGDAVNTLSFRYDAVGNLLSAGDAYSQYALTYDALNRLSTVDNRGTPHAPQVKLVAGYDAAGNRTSLADDTGVTVSSAYDARNLLVSRTWTGGEVAAARAEFGYDSRGLLASLTRYASPDASAAIGSSAYRYDAEGRLENIKHFGAAGETLVEYAYVRDLANQLIGEAHHGHSYSYTRDALGQLTGTAIDDAAAEAYAYDAHGNRTNSGEVIGADNRLLENATSRFEYDGEGNLVRRIDKATGEVTEYVYDHRQRLVSGTRRSPTGALLSSVINTYDVFNRRIARTVDVDGTGPLPATTTHTVYDGDHAWADYDESGRAVVRFLFGDGVDDILARWRPSEGLAWYLTDHLGTVRDIVDAAGTVVDTLEYDSFGRIIFQSNAAVSDRFTFTGREWDPQLSLYYYRARFYDPAAGRFISQDPLGFGSGDSNLYRYVGNSPLDFTDPSGLLALTECAFVRAVDTTINIACTVQKMSLDGSLASQDIDRQVENAFQLMNTAFDVLPFGSSMALKTTMRAITMVQTAQALASLAVNDNLFNLLEVAETYVVEAARMYEQGAAATFQEALHAFAQSDNKQLLLTKMVCGAANMGLMVLSAKSRCFVAGTPVVVSLLPPEELAQQAADQFGITMFDVLASAALGGVIAARRLRREEDDPATQQQARDAFFEEFDEDADEQDVGFIESCVGAQVGSDEPATIDELGEVPCDVSADIGSTDSSRHAKRKWSLAMFACLLLALICGLPRLLSTGTAATTCAAAASQEANRAQLGALESIVKPIETIRCGERIVAELPPGVEAVNEPEPDPATWRLVEVELHGDAGERVEVHLLRPLAWLEQVGKLPDGEFLFRADELGIEGTAAVLRVQPCPEIRSGRGHVVTGTFRHTSGSLVELTLESEPEPIICTSGHPIWSQSQQAFVSASALRRGEPIRLAAGKLSRVRHLQPHPGTASVFNLEVNRHHVYHVGESGLLVHNSGVESCDSGESSPDSRKSEQKRNALGQFMPYSDGDVPPGSLAVADFIAHARKNGLDVVGEQITVNTPFGQRRYDVVLRDPATGRNIGVEVKGSRSSFERREPQQLAGDRWLQQQDGLEAVGKAKGIFIREVIKILWERP